MKSFVRSTLGLLLAAGGMTSLGAQAPAPTLTKAERAQLLAVQTAMQARDYATAAGAITTAKAGATTGYARYLASSYELRLGLDTNNRPLQAKAIEAMLSSGAAPTASREELYKNQGALALADNRFELAENAFSKWAEASPNSPEPLIALAEVKDDRKKYAESVALIERAIELRRASGQPVPESWYRRGIKHAFDARLAAPSIKLSQQLVAAYPTRENWRDALLIYRDVGAPDEQAKLDLLRLMRASKALGGERDYLLAAEAFSTDKLPAESQAVLKEGVDAKMVDPKKATFKELIAGTDKRAASDKKALAALDKKAQAGDGEAALKAADNHYAFGEYAKAAELYRLALTKGGIDAGIVNTRLGMSLALAGQRAEAETVLRTVNGPRANLASYWLVWLAQGSRAG